MRNKPSPKTTRGRAASTPTDIPLRGWQDVIRRVYNKLERDNISIISAGVAFYGMLSIFPALAAIVTLYALVADPSTVQQHFSSVSGFMPVDVINIISDQLTALASRDTEGLSIGLIIGVLTAIWSAHRAMDALVRAITVAYGEEEDRGLLKMILLTFGLTFGAILMVVVVLILLVFIPTVTAFLPSTSYFVQIAPYARWLAFVVLVIFTIGVLHRSAPPRRPASWRWLSVGSVLATLLWLGGSVAFSVYVQQFDTYNKTYGTLGAIVVLLMWFYLTTYSIVLGAAVNAELEHQTTRDTTIGEDKPIGERGAFVADHIAEIPD